MCRGAASTRSRASGSHGTTRWAPRSMCRYISSWVAARWPVARLNISCVRCRRLPSLEDWDSDAQPLYRVAYCAAARIGTCAFKKLRTRPIVRCLSSSGSFHG